MYKKTNRSQEFFTMRGKYSTRVSPRGFGTLQPLVMDIDSTASAAIQRQIETVRDLYDVIQKTTDIETRNAAVCQLNQLRGALGSWRGEFHNQEHWPTARMFMSVARLLLGPEGFEFILTEVRALREQHAEFLWTEIEKCLNETKSPKQPS